MKKQNLILISLFAISLFSCSNNEKKENENNIETTFISLSDCLSTLSSLAEYETLNASKANISKINKINDTKTETTSTKYIYDDISSYEEGTIIKSSETGSITDTFTARNLIQQTKYIEDDTSNSFDMLYQIKDFENENISSNTIEYKYVFDTESEATNLGISSSDYILKDNALIDNSTGLSNSIYQFIGNYLINPLSTLSNNQITKTIENEKETYSFSAYYEIEGDMDDIQKHQFDFEFIIENEKIISGTYKYQEIDYRVDDENDAYVSSEEISYTIFYETKGVFDKNFDINDYFLKEINEISLHSNSKNKDIENVLNIPLNYNYIYAYASSFSPLKAQNTSLILESSSNEDVASISNDILELNSTGETTLTLSTFLNTGDFEFSYTTFTLDIKIVEVEVESVNFSSYLTSAEIYDNLLYEGETYSISYNVSPSKAKQAVTIKSSDEEIIKASVDTTNKKIKLQALKEGEATIRLESKYYPNVYDEITFTVENLLDDESLLNVILSSTYKCTNTIKDYGWDSYTLNFYEDGTLKNVLKLNDETTSELTASYTISKRTITISNWSEDAFHIYDKGTIVNNGKKLILEDNSSTYVTHKYYAI